MPEHALSRPAQMVSALVVGSARRGGELTELLGSERVEAIDGLLAARAAAWAGEVASGRVRSASGPGGVGREADLVRGLFGAYGGPVFVVWPDLPQWRPLHAEGALNDLDDGCDVSLGPVFEGGFYLVAMARPIPELFRLPRDAWLAPDALAQALGAVNAAGLTVGMLRPERGLRRAADVGAALADPLLDDELRGLLAG